MIGVAPSGYRLRWADPSDASDVDALAELADLGHGADEADGHAPWVAEGVRASLSPDRAVDVHFVMAEHEATGAAASMASIIPQTWTVGGHPVRIARLESFATLPGHRRRGLVRATIGALHRRGDELGCTVRAISGLPWFYRQFGYDYALEHEGGWGVAFADEPADVALRPLAADDVEHSAALYEQAGRESYAWCPRDPAFWKAVVTSGGTDGADGAERWLAVDRAGELVGYLVHRVRGTSGAVVVPELELADRTVFGPGLVAALRQVAPAAAGVYFQLGSSHPLYDHWTGCDLAVRPHAWFVSVPDWAALFTAIEPCVGGFGGELRISEYTSGVRLRFEDGRWAAAEPWSPVAAGPSEPASAAFPPGTLAKLVLGYRSLDQLLEAYPDCEAGGEAADVLRALFPPRWSHVRAMQ